MNFTNETKKTVVSAENLSFSTNITNGECSYPNISPLKGDIFYKTDCSIIVTEILW
jgi:hypothetical protein